MPAKMQQSYKMKIFLIIFEIFFLQGQVDAINLPPEIQLCHRSDPELNRCFSKSFESGIGAFAKGYKPLKLTSLEKVHVKKLEINGAQTGSVALDQKYDNMTIFGITSVKVKKANLDMDTLIWKLDLNSEIAMKANYIIKGKILLFPINAHGKCQVILQNVTSNHVVKLNRIQKKNKMYFNITDHTLVVRPEKVIYDFENAFPSNKAISDQILKTVNENGLTIFDDVRPGFEQIFAMLFQNVANKIFSKIPEDELFLE